MGNLSQNEVKELLSGNASEYKFYEPTVEDQNRIVSFNDFALEMLESAAFFLTNLSRAYEMFVKHNYESSHIKDNVKELEDSIKLCEQSIGRKKLAAAPLSNYKRRMDMINWRLKKINENGLFDQHKKYLLFIQNTYDLIKGSLQAVN